MADAQTRKLARQIVDINHRLKSIETTPQLAHSSIDDRGLPVYDKEGNLVAKIGKQDDGTWGAPPLAGPTPPMPTGLQALGGPGTIHVTWTGEFSEGAACPLDFDVLEVLVNGALSGSISNRDGGSVSISSPSGQHYVSARIRTLVPRHSDTTSPFAVEVGPPADQLFIDAKEEIDGAKEAIEGAKQEIADERTAREEALEAAQEELARLDAALDGVPSSEALEEIRTGLGNALSAAEAAEREASEARTSAEAAIADALAAVGIARDKGRIYYQPTAPTDDEAKSPNNLWIDSDDGRVYIWNGSVWEESQSEDLRDAAQAAATALAAAEAAEAKAQAAASAAATAQAAAEAAQSTADQATTDARSAWNDAVAAKAAADDALEKYGPLDQRTIDAQEAADAAQAEAAAALAEASAAKGLAEEAVREVGDTVRDTVIEYAVGTSETVAPTSGWSTSTPTRTPGSFVWMRTVVTYADGDTSTTSPALLTGNDGAKGDKGATGAKGDKGDRGTDGVAGKDGVGLASTALAYALSTSGTTAPSSGWTASVPTLVKGRYLWTRTIWTYTDSTAETGYSVAYVAQDGNKGDDGIAGKDGVGIKSTAITYAASSSGTTAPSSGWSSQPPAAAAGQYVWTRTIWTYTDNSTETGYSVGKIGDTGAKGSTGATGPKGDTGSTGAQGVSVSSVDPFFRTVSRTASAPARPSGMTPSGWVTTEPAWSSNTKLYRAERIVYSNGVVSWTVPTLVAAYEGIVQVQTSVNGKNSITRSTSNASGTGVVAGDAWYKVDSNGDTMAMWIWDGSKWVASKVRNEMIDTIDVNKLKVHDRLEVIGDAVIDKIWADGIAAKAVTASKLTVAPGNVYRDPMLTDPASWNSNYFQTSGGYGGGGSILLPASASQTGSYDALGASVVATRTRVEPGVTYRHTFWFKSSIPVAARNRVLMYRRYYALDGTQVGGTVARAQADPAPADVWTQASGEETVPEGGVTMVVGFYAQAAHNGEVRFSDPAIIPKVGAVLIENGSVGADKIIADEVAAEVSHLVKARIENLTVTDGATINEAVITKLATEMITAGVLRTAAEGQRVVIDESGIVMYGVDDDGVEFELVRIGPDGDNLITAGDTSISPDGVQAPAGTFDELAVGGEDLNTILDALPRGMRAWGTLSENSKFDSDTTKFARRAELQTTLLPDRLYRVQLSSHFLDVSSSSNATVREELRYSLDQTNITTGISPESGRKEWTGTWIRQHVQTGNTRSVPGLEFLLDTEGWTEERHFWLMFMILPEQADRPVRVVARSDYPVTLSVEDMGPSQPGLLKRWNDGSGTGTQDPEPTKRRYTKTYNSTGYRVYDNNGSDTSGNDKDVVQGLYAGGPSRLLRKGGWLFPSWTSDLSGAKIEKVEMYVYMNHSYYTAGATVNACVWSSPMRDNLTNFQQIKGWKRNTGKWITIPKAYHNGFKNGTYVGVGVKPTTSYAEQYARFNASGARVRITYVK